MPRHLCDVQSAFRNLIQSQSFFAERQTKEEATKLGHQDPFLTKESPLPDRTFRQYWHCFYTYKFSQKSPHLLTLNQCFYEPAARR